MSLLPTRLDTSFERLLQLLPSNYALLAYETGAFVRARKIRTPEQLLQLVLDYCARDQSLRDCAGQMTLRAERVTDMAVNRRLKGCVGWIKALLRERIGVPTAALSMADRRVVVVDSSSVQGPGATRTWYRLHLAVDLLKLELLSVVFSDDQSGDEIGHHELSAGDVVLADRGFNQLKDWRSQVQRGIEIVVRYNPEGTKVCERHTDQKVDVYRWLEASTSSRECLEVYRGNGSQALAGYLHALALPEAQAKEARRRVRARAKKKGRTPSARTLLFAGWTLIFTTLAPAQLPTEAVGELYRLRWQVELVIKRLKSVLDLDALRTRQGSALAELYLHGKLLYAWMLEQLAGQRCGRHWASLTEPRQATPWRVWKALHQELCVLISGVMHWDLSRWESCLSVMQERRRQRKLQTFPSRIHQLIVFQQVAGLSNLEVQDA